VNLSYFKQFVFGLDRMKTKNIESTCNHIYFVLSWNDIALCVCDL
jgi:hypothetical protein